MMQMNYDELRLSQVGDPVSVTCCGFCPSRDLTPRTHSRKPRLSQRQDLNCSNPPLAKFLLPTVSITHGQLQSKYSEWEIPGINNAKF